MACPRCGSDNHGKDSPRCPSVTNPHFRKYAEAIERKAARRANASADALMRANRKRTKKKGCLPVLVAVALWLVLLTAILVLW